MNCTLTEPRISAYRRRGFLVVDDLLDAAELALWRAAVDEAVAERVARAGNDATEDDYYRNVFTQCVIPVEEQCGGARADSRQPLGADGGRAGRRGLDPPVP